MSIPAVQQMMSELRRRGIEVTPEQAGEVLTLAHQINAAAAQKKPGLMIEWLGDTNFHYYVESPKGMPLNTLIGMMELVKLELLSHQRDALRANAK